MLSFIWSSQEHCDKQGDEFFTCLDRKEEISEKDGVTLMRSEGSDRKGDGYGSMKLCDACVFQWPSYIG